MGRFRPDAVEPRKLAARRCRQQRRAWVLPLLALLERQLNTSNSWNSDKKGSSTPDFWELPYVGLELLISFGGVLEVYDAIAVLGIWCIGLWPSEVLTAALQLALWLSGARTPGLRGCQGVAWDLLRLPAALVAPSSR